MRTIRHRVTITLGAMGILAALSAPLSADVPRKQPIGRYTDLWTKSPFTVPPVVDKTETPVENPLDDYTLAGVCKLKDGWFVVLINKKQRDERVRIKPNIEHNIENEEGFKVVKVEQGEGHMDTRVEIKTRSGKTGWVEYDKKFITLRRAVPTGGGAAPNPGAPNQPPIPTRPTANPQPPNPNGGNADGRPTRVRRVPVPAPPSR